MLDSFFVHEELFFALHLLAYKTSKRIMFSLDKSSTPTLPFFGDQRQHLTQLRFGWPTSTMLGVKLNSLCQSIKKIY